MKKIVTNKDRKTENEELKIQLARALADYDNLRKRTEREKKEFEKLANLRLLVKLLPVLDILRKAQCHLKDPGVEMTIKQFEETLATEGLEEMKVKPGDTFDPEIHEAVEKVVNNKDRGKIIEVVSPGWRFKEGPVIRHTKVRVYGPSANGKEKKLEREMQRGDYV